MKSNIFEKVLNQISLDSRIEDGIFTFEKNNHMDVLREYFIDRGVDESIVIEYCNTVLEGKYPERQAYNAKGILVTFPTPEYKADAIKRGTHFEEDPTRKAQNVFQSSTPGSAPKKPADDGGKTNLPLSQTNSVPPASDVSTPAAPAAPSNAPEPVSVPAATNVAPQQSPEPVVPVAEPTKLPPVPIKPPEEREANKNVIKKMLKGDDYMLETMIDWFLYNAPEKLLEEIKKRI